jgi:adenylate cyclase, class 2
MSRSSLAKSLTHTNFEFKARLERERHVRAALERVRARFVGTDHQIDTYFRVPAGRLKLREGKIENALIFYQRANAQRARQSNVRLVELPPGNRVKPVLVAALGVLAVVDKRRDIYFVGNVKVQLDRVRGLGKFVEVEAIKKSRAEAGSAKITNRTIRQQAREFQKLLGIADSEIIPLSYSDMVLRKSGLGVGDPRSSA